MDLIKNFYSKGNSNNNNLVIEEKYMDKIGYWLNNMRFYDDIIEYSYFVSCLTKICKELGINIGNLVRFRSNKTRFNNDSFNKVGSFSFNYSDNDKVNKKNVITCYGCNELNLFNGLYNEEPIIKISDEKSTFYYAIGDWRLSLIKYETRLNDDSVLTRDYLYDKVIFSIAGLDSCFVIQIDGINELNNEDVFVEYLRKLSYPYDMVEVYNKLCEISIGKRLGKYSNIALNEYRKEDNKYNLINSIVISNGKIKNVLRTVNDKTISCDGDGNWNYVLMDKDVTLSVSSGDKTTFNIVAMNDTVIDEYVNGYLNYDVGVARREADEFKVKMRKKLGFDGKNR